MDRVPAARGKCAKSPKRVSEKMGNAVMECAVGGYSDRSYSIDACSSYWYNSASCTLSVDIMNRCFGKKRLSISRIYRNALAGIARFRRAADNS